MRDYRTISMWHDTVPGDDYQPRPPLPGDTDVDVCVIGAGYTGLWTAYYLKKADSSLRIAIVEREIAGFGASGRNGAWVSPFFATAAHKLAKAGSRDGALALQREMLNTVAEVGRVCEAEGIDADYHRCGNLVFARTQAQLAAGRAEYEYLRDWGFGEDDLFWLSAAEARERVAMSGALGAMYSPHCARVHPAKLVRGLARVVESLGVPIYERTTVLDRSRSGVATSSGKVRAEVTVRGTEGYSVDLPRLRRALIPVYSLMLATEPLPNAVWKEIGWQNGECCCDGRHMLVYLSRTADGRIAMGGRGAPYHFGSKIDECFESEPAVFDALYGELCELFPAVKGAVVTHRWGGPIGIARDWCSSVGLDRAAGDAWAFGYIGDGVATTNLAGRTLADLVTGRRSELTALPWVGHQSKKWEPEPLRWIGVNVAQAMMAGADRVEVRTGKPSRRAKLIEKLVG
jgi:glycine/D-amino acid oxidase-like deaminating enzyme